MLTVCVNQLVVEARLLAGGYRCPVCGGVLRPWGWARFRVVWDGFAGRGVSRARFAPRRARCSACGATHVLLPVLFFSRRADSARVIARAVEWRAAGLGWRRIASRLARPPTTVRRWLKAAGTAAEAGAGVLLAAAFEVAPDPAAVSPRPAGSPLGGLVAVLSALAAAVGARWRRPAGSWQSAGAAACRSRLLQASWWAGEAQHELALMPAWWSETGLAPGL